VYIDVQVRDAHGNKTSIGKSYVACYSEAAVDRACGHTGSRTNCSSIFATTISFSASNGTTNGDSESYVKEVERIL
jgi:hypothetical protein